jgi:hypothetical protein
MQNEHSKPKHNRLIGLLSGWLSSQITRAQLAIFGLIGAVWEHRRFHRVSYRIIMRRLQRL